MRAAQLPGSAVRTASLPLGRLGHTYMHELNHALSNPTALQFYYLTPMARLQEELNRYNKEGVDLFRKTACYRKRVPYLTIVLI